MSDRRILSATAAAGMATPMSFALFVDQNKTPEQTLGKAFQMLYQNKRNTEMKKMLCSNRQHVFWDPKATTDNIKYFI